MKPLPQNDVTIERLQDAYRLAQFSEAAAAIDAALMTPKMIDGALVLLRARIALKTNPGDALEVLTRHGASLRTARQRAEAALLCGLAYARLDDPAAAAAKFDVVARSTRDRNLLAELIYVRAQAAWIVRKLPLAERLVTEALAVAHGDLRFEVAVLQGTIAAARGKMTEQGAILLQALHELHRDADPAALPWAVISSQVASLARELPGTALRDAAYQEMDRVPWTADLDRYRFSMTRALGWRHALDGDYFNAFRRLREAGRYAPSPAWQVMATCDRAYLATVLGQRRWAEQELSDAHELAARIAWPALDGEERFALLVLAELFAPHDASLALAYVARYKSTRSNVDPTLSSRNDRRVDATEAYAFGVVQAALGERREAVRSLTTAYRIFADVGYEWRAGRSALALATLTDRTAWEERARTMLRGYPQSWLVAAADRPHTTIASERTRLTPAQRTVYDLLARGRSTSEIAAELGRSEYTVRNHIKVIFKVFGVNSRTALLARAHAT